MTTTIRDIGNSKGIILPKSILSQCDIQKDVSIEIKHHSIVITASPKAKRKGWAKAFKEMAENGDDTLAIPDVLIEDNTDDWTWK